MTPSSRKIITISGTPGAGKDTTIKGSIASFPYELENKLSTMTRAPRENNGVLEVNGIDGRFITREKMSDLIAAGLTIEYDEHKGAIYATTVDALESIWAQGQIPICDIDVKGAKNIQKRYPNVLQIFIDPQLSTREYATRILKRAGVTDAAIQEIQNQVVGLEGSDLISQLSEIVDRLQLKGLTGEIFREGMERIPFELEEGKSFQHVIYNPNGKLEETLKQVRGIIEKYLYGEHIRTRLDALVPVVESLVMERFHGESSGHDIHHLRNVMTLARSIQAKEGGNPLVIAIAALVHDVHRLMPKRHNEYCQPAESLDEIRTLLHGCDITEDELAQILYCVAHHEEYSFSTVGKGSHTIEALILQDADNLEAMGATGIARTFAFGGAKGHPIFLPDQHISQKDTYDEGVHDESSISHFYSKLLKLKDTMNTQTGIHLAQKRHEVMEQFLEQFFAEQAGKC